MAKNTEENKEQLKEKLNYLGLNLTRIPKVLKEFQSFSFKPTKSYDDTSYKTYKHINVNDIQILLTPTDRLTDLNQKYKLASPLSSYLDSKSQENVEKFTTFLSMLKEVNIEQIKYIEKEQEKLKKVLPYEVKYSNNYIWQIYYSDISNQYFMLVPTNETNNSAFFYLLKKKIESSKTRKKETIFVPITHEEYSGNYLVQSQIIDLENYLWYFTKQWPNIYEVYDIKKNMVLKVVGQTKVYGDITSDYVITLETKDQALQWYKLVKALFILSTGMPNDYIFQTEITKEGELKFVHEEHTEIKYESLPIFIKEQANNKKILVGLENKKLIKEQEELEELKQITEKQTEEFLNKQRQIATFLECKKTFLGKIKYYFGNRKKHMGSIESYKEKNKFTPNNENKNKQYFDNEETKETYTIEDLIEICTKLEGRKKMVKNLEMDKKALKLKKINLERKIKNANIYLNEIELHKKNIFEFWKFTNKDELPSLNEGEEEKNSEKEKIGKSFNYEEDIEELGKKMDELQRRKLSKNETDSIFAVKQALISSQILNNTKNNSLSQEQKQKLQKQLDILKKEYIEDFANIQVNDFDIFGGMLEDKTKVKILHNEKHREIEKDKYKTLNITSNTELELYIDNLRSKLQLLNEAFHKITTPFELPIYIAKVGNIEDEKIEQNLYIANLNATEELYQKAKKMNKEDTIHFCKILLPEGSPLLFYTNIIYYDNINKTLPLGMDVTTEVLINLKDKNLKNTKQKEFYINYQIDEYNHKIIKVNMLEYQV